jgi:hypothetical protein
LPYFLPRGLRYRSGVSTRPLQKHRRRYPSPHNTSTLDHHSRFSVLQEDVPAEEGQEQVFVRALLLAWFATQNKSLLGAKCLVSQTSCLPLENSKRFLELSCLLTCLRLYTNQRIQSCLLCQLCNLDL